MTPTHLSFTTLGSGYIWYPVHSLSPWQLVYPTTFRILTRFTCFCVICYCSGVTNVQITQESMPHFLTLRLYLFFILQTQAGIQVFQMHLEHYIYTFVFAPHAFRQILDYIYTEVVVLVQAAARGSFQSQFINHPHFFLPLSCGKKPLLPVTE